jgi:hypothetical protein
MLIGHRAALAVSYSWTGGLQLGILHEADDTSCRFM